jgi:aldehyde dehydrogenase (NAD+)
MQDILQTLHIQLLNPSYSTGLSWGGTNSREVREINSPIDGKLIASVCMAHAQDYEQTVLQAQKAFVEWQKVPAPKRGEIVRLIGQELRKHKQALGTLVTLEMGKILQEGLGEVQEMIDICDFAVGLSRQLYGLTMHSERAEHRMYEQYHPLGIVGIISAFNFPVAVWSWNAMLAAVCGDVCIWKPSEKTPLTAIACQHIISKVLQENDVPEGVFNLVIGGADIGQLWPKTNGALISATGHRMGKHVSKAVCRQVGNHSGTGGNNAIIITPHARLNLLCGPLFLVCRYCGQRCTTTRRLMYNRCVCK